VRPCAAAGAFQKIVAPVEVKWATIPTGAACADAPEAAAVEAAAGDAEALAAGVAEALAMLEALADAVAAAVL